ncbi:hypothetical protein NNJEOMEG_00303 [Fundidesulfovibrio magnetotacticus]|uniref:Uncharacterized protein n=1 Tax=Fundidesulfovibrio magnetotacticus TaxID=2730080 RepID=A0A6V8LQ69_9BACT|nr:hypothetical protein [Fundidesulfovibrio magnetotacticus]GFK92478.1 hypothetical protein NNJEOMEG_00303 [Fundidesulfovibrio magnetotacticus]
MHVSHTQPGRALRLALLTLALLAAACQPKTPVTEPRPEPAPITVAGADALDVDTAYTQAVEAFWSARYKAAAALFESISRRQDDQAYRARALFGLACARLAAAQNQDDLKAARDIWRQWEMASVGDPAQSDPRMLSPFLQNDRLLAPARENREARPLLPPKPAPADADLARRLQEKEKEVLHLQKQIKALETIHREIQEKKKMGSQ